jgi:hypothetical protein
MKCTDARAVLPLLIYGELEPKEQAALQDHLAHCAACRRERQALTSVRKLLDAAPVPRVAVDLPRLYQTQADRQALRSWRRVAVVAAAVAALLLLAVWLRLEVRLGSDQLVVRWGAPPDTAPTPIPPQLTASQTALPPETEAELRVLSDLIHALKQDADGRDRHVEERLDRLQRHVQILQAQADQRWSTTEESVAALYLLTRKGENP